MFQQHNNACKQSTIKHWAFSVRMRICFHLKQGSSFTSLFFLSHKMEPLDFLSQIPVTKKAMRRKLKFRLDLVLSHVVSLSWTVDISSMAIPGKHSMGLVEGLLSSVGVLEWALHVLDWDVAYSACAIFLATQPSLGAYTSNTDGLSCEVWDNNREDVTIKYVNLNKSISWMTYRSEESSKGEYSKAMWEAAAIAVGDRTCCSEYRLIKFRLTFLRVRFPLWSP